MILFLERWIFLALVFFAPFQVRKIIFSWGNWFNEWTSVFFYATDVLILSLLALWLFRFIRYPKFDRNKITIGDLSLAVFLILSLLSLTAADNQGLGWYRLLKLLELAALYFYVRFSFGRVFRYSEVVRILIASGLIQSAVAIAQSLCQRSVGLSWLGESVLRTNFSGVAVVPLADGHFLRAYGLMPHPNLLAFWLFLAIFAFYFWFFYLQKKHNFWLAASIYFPLLWAFYATFSRVIVGLWFLGIAAWLGLFFFKRNHCLTANRDWAKRLRCLAAATILISTIFSSVYWPAVKSRLLISSREQAVTQRILYNQIAGETTAEQAVLGVGIGQFVWELGKNFAGAPPYFFQPVHNIYLLISSEIGVAGLLAFLLFIFYCFNGYRRRVGLKSWPRFSLFLVSLSLLAMGLFDHFLLTSQQGGIAFWSILGIMDAFSRKKPYALS